MPYAALDGGQVYARSLSLFLRSWGVLRTQSPALFPVKGREPGDYAGMMAAGSDISSWADDGPCRPR